MIHVVRKVMKIDFHVLHFLNEHAILVHILHINPTSNAIPNLKEHKRDVKALIVSKQELQQLISVMLGRKFSDEKFSNIKINISPDQSNFF